jgi:hypothetical protein
MESRTELKYQYWKEELHKCEACFEWIDGKIVRLCKSERVFYYHPFCLICMCRRTPNSVYFAKPK